jgi:hypothetical protein
MYQRFLITNHPSDRVVTQGTEDDSIVLRGKAALRPPHWKGSGPVVLRHGLETMVRHGLKAIGQPLTQLLK